MPNNLIETKKKVQEVSALALQGFTGLSLKLDFVNRDKNSWQILDNFDLYVPGSLRKVLPAVLYGGPYGANLLNCLEYQAQANNPNGGIRRLIGAGADGNIYDLASLTPTVPYVVTNYLLGAPITIPTILQFPGYFVPFNFRSWQANTAYLLHDAILEYGPNGLIYVFAVTQPGTSGPNEPIWPANGTVSDNAPNPTWNVSILGTTVDGTVHWINEGKPAWAPVTVEPLAKRIIDSNGNIEVVVSRSSLFFSGLVQPAWTIVNGGLTADFDLVWQCQSATQWEAGHAYNIGDLVIDPNGNLERVTTAGTSAGANMLVWTNVGVPNSNRFFAYYLAIISPGTQPIRLVEWQYDPTSTSETPKITVGQMGCSPATVPPEISGEVVTPNLNGYAPAAGRAYQWTYYNPQTLQESSPSPFVGKTKIIEVDNSDASVTINGSVLLPLPQSTKVNVFSSYQSFYVAIPVSVMTPIIGQGYTTIRIYATQDGGTTFFLVNTLYDNNGNQISNGDGSIPISLLLALSAANSWTDYFPIPEPQAKAPSVRVYEGSGPINYAPDPQNLGAEAWFPGYVNPGPIFIVEGGAPDGFNAFELDGPNNGQSVYRSVIFNVTHGSTYYFQMFLDKVSGSGGTMFARAVNFNGVPIAASTLTQTDGNSGILSATFTAPSNKIYLQVGANGVTIVAGQALIWADPILQLGSALNPIVTNYPTTDTSLVLPAPLPFANNPPPIARMAEAFLDAFIFVDHQDPSKFWWSQQGLYELVGVNSFQRTTTNVGTAILQLIRMLDTLVIVKERSMEQITTYPPPPPTAIDPQHGGLSYRNGVPFGAGIISLMTHGLGKLALSESLTEQQQIDAEFQAILVGDDIKPIIDSIDPSELYAQNLTVVLPSPAVLNTLNLYLLAFKTSRSF